MRGLEYSTVTIFASFLILITTLVMAILGRQLKGGAGWIFLAAGGILIMASGLTEEIQTVPIQPGSFQGRKGRYCGVGWPLGCG